jgi:hypothetical protein
MSMRIRESPWERGGGSQSANPCPPSSHRAEVNRPPPPAVPRRWAQHAAGLDVLPLLPPGLGEGAAAALDRYGRERRGEALLGRMVAAAGARH